MAYVSTPARRAALRRAQLISAQKRRKYGVKYQTKNAVRQGYTRAKLNKKKTVKYAAITLAGTAVAVGAYKGYKSPTGKYTKGMTKSTLKAYRGGKRGAALKTHQNRVRPLVKKNAGMRVQSRSHPVFHANAAGARRVAFEHMHAHGITPISQQNKAHLKLVPRKY